MHQLKKIYALGFTMLLASLATVFAQDADKAVATSRDMGKSNLDFNTE